MKTAKKLTSLFLALMLVISVAACGRAPVTDGLFENATYKSDTALGSGNTEIAVDVKVGEDSVRLTVKTDKTTLGDALLELGVIAGEDSEYGLFVKTVNGITADYDKDGAFWSLEQNGQMLMTGVDSTEIANGEVYEFVYSK